MFQLGIAQLFLSHAVTPQIGFLTRCTQSSLQLFCAPVHGFAVDCRILSSLVQRLKIFLQFFNALGQLQNSGTGLVQPLAVCFKF